MALGVVLHSSQVFNPDKTWVIYSPLSVSITNSVIEIIHTFRMPAFFMVSGFFCLFSIRKYGEETFLRIRCERILIPLVTTALTLNSIQAVLLDKSGWRSFNLYEYVHNGLWHTHLWFLNYLLLYYIIAYLASKLISVFGEKWRLPMGDHIDRLPRMTVFLLPILTILLIGIARLAASIQNPFFGVFPLFKLAFYAQFFVFGILLSWRKHLLHKFIHISPLKIIIMIATLIMVDVMVDGLLENQRLATFLFVDKYIHALVIWLECALCFYLFKQFADRPSKISLFFSNSSYTVYLFHHVLVVAFGLAFIHFGIGGYWGLASLISIVFLASTLIHVFVISRSNYLNYLFNGKKLANNGKTSVRL
ncbi:MAG: acyltransferase family protein [Desulfuromonadales bacterium]|nr:acyltransferase family protein [Desulfuromonadales bacterium]